MRGCLARRKMLFGVDHTRLTYRYQGCNFRLTDVSGEPVKGILA